MRKSKLKTFFIILGSVLLSVFCVVLIGVASDGFDNWRNPQEWSLTEVNPNNIMGVANYTIESTENDEADIKVTVTEDGEIKIIGKNEAEEVVKLAVQSVVLQADTYNLECHAETSNETYFVTIEAGEGEDAVVIEEGKFTVDVAGTYTVYITILPGVEIDETFSPVLVKGEKAQDFFTLK